MGSIKPFTAFLAGVLSAGGVGAGFMAAAAPGDIIHEASSGHVCVTQAQAACYATCAINAGTWDGAAANMLSVRAWRSPQCESGFASEVGGIKAAPAANVPIGAIIHGVAQ